MSYSDYKFQFRRVKERSFIMIEDKNNGGRSVINDIDKVITRIANLHKINPVEFYIIYMDSEKKWDGYTFSTKTFYPVREDHWLKAALKVISYEQ